MILEEIQSSVKDKTAFKKRSISVSNKNSAISIRKLIVNYLTKKQLILREKLRMIIREKATDYGDTQEEQQRKYSNICDDLTRKYESLTSVLAALRKGEVHKSEREKFREAWSNDPEMLDILEALKSFSFQTEDNKTHRSTLQKLIRNIIHNKLRLKSNLETRLDNTMSIYKSRKSMCPSVRLSKTSNLSKRLEAMKAGHKRPKPIKLTIEPFRVHDSEGSQTKLTPASSWMYNIENYKREVTSKPSRQAKIIDLS